MLLISLAQGLKVILRYLSKLDLISFSLYVSAGGSDDYAIDKGGVPYAFTFELGAEKYGFAVEEAQLKNTVEEGYIAIYGMIMQALQM